MTNSMVFASINGPDLYRIISNMHDAIDGEKKSNVVMACLAIAINIQLPDITGPQLVKAISDVSEYAALMCSAIDNPIDPKKAN